MADRCYTVDTTRSTFVVRLRGDLDLAREPEFQEIVAAYLGAGERDVVVDLGAVTFLDSTALRLLVSLRQWAHKRGRTVSLRAVPPHAAQLLRIAGLTDVFPESPPGPTAG